MDNPPSNIAQQPLNIARTGGNNVRSGGNNDSPGVRIDNPPLNIARTGRNNVSLGVNSDQQSLCFEAFFIKNTPKLPKTTKNVIAENEERVTYPHHAPKILFPQVWVKLEL